MSARRTFVVFADDWGRHPSSCQHLFRRIAPAHRVLWVNTVGTRTPTLSRADLARAAGKLREWTGGGPDPSPDDVPVEVLRPLMTPFDRWRPLRRLNSNLLTRAIREALGEGDPPIVVTTIPNAAGVIGRLGEAASIYYCVDEFSEWPGADRATMLEMERELLGKVDLVIATADKLFDDKSARHPRVRLLKHGVDWERFRSPEGKAPAELLALPRPLLGCVGLIDERIDVERVVDLALSRREASFVFVGPRQLPPGPLDSLDNVHFLPPVPYEQVPAVLAALDVALLPYVESALTERINPLKLREFMASGVPVVATPLPEVTAFAAWIHLARDAAGWSSGIAAALAEGRTRASERAACVREDGWDRRAEEFQRFCREAEETARAATGVRPGPPGGDA